MTFGHTQGYYDLRSYLKWPSVMFKVIRPLVDITVTFGHNHAHSATKTFGHNHPNFGPFLKVIVTLTLNQGHKVWHHLIANVTKYHHAKFGEWGWNSLWEITPDKVFDEFSHCIGSSLAIWRLLLAVIHVYHAENNCLWSRCFH